MPTMKCSLLSWSSSLPSLLLVLNNLFQASSSFVLQFRHHNDFSRFLETRLSAQQQQQSPPPAPPAAHAVPVVVVGSESSPAALGADLALSAYGILTGNNPPSNSVSLLKTPSASDLYQHLLEVQSQHGGVKPALHWTLDPGSLTREIMTPQISEAVSLLGIHLNTASETDTTFGGAGVSPELARRSTENIKEVLNWRQAGGKAIATLDLALHLALLQAHCLPKSKPVLGDSYHVLLPPNDPTGSAVLVDYQYDEKSFGMGTDPLSCPTREVLICGTPPAQAPSAVAAGAYLALKSQGINAIDAGCIAASVAARPLAVEGQPHVESIADLCRHVRRTGAKEAPGMLRQKYKEYGNV